MTSKVLIITGMHRSGTSLTAQYLSECGLHIGSDLLAFDSGDRQNTYNGHHEDREFLDFHRRILARKKIYAFPTQEFKLPVNIFDKRKACKLLADRKNLSQWGWKDPRTTLFLNFWDGIIENPKYLFLVRHPLSVVDSLVRRGKDPDISRQPIIGLKSWRLFNQKILSFFQEHRSKVLIFNIDDFFSRHKTLINSLNNNLGIELKSLPLSSIISPKAFNNQKTQFVDPVEKMREKYQQEVEECLFLYKELIEQYYEYFPM